MKKILSVILVLAMLCLLPSCGFGPDKMEKQYIQIAQEYLDAENFKKAKDVINEGLEEKPDSKFFSQMLAEIEEAEEAAKPPVPTVDEVKSRFIEFYNLVQKWYITGVVLLDKSEPVSYDYTFEATGITDNVFGNMVTEPGITSLSDLDNLFLGYCTEESYEEIKSWGPPLGFYDEIDGKLFQSHIIGGWTDSSEFDDLSVEVTPIGEEAFSVTFLRIYHDCDEVTVYECTYPYTRNDSGKFRFGKMLQKIVTDYSTFKKYKVIESDTTPVVRRFPHDEAEVVISLNKDQVVNVSVKYGGWAYMTTENDEAGWIKCSSIAEYTETQSEGKSGKSYNGNVVNDVVNAGARVVNGVLNSIF